MYLFIATIFIAELIIALTLIIIVVKADKKVCEINSKVVNFLPVLEDTLKSVKGIAANLQDSIENFFCFIRKKRRQLTMKIVVAVIIYASLFFFKGRFKKAATVFQMLVLLKDYWDELAV